MFPAALLVACVHAGPPAQVAITRNDVGLLFVDVEVQGPRSFLLDTGAGTSVLTPATAAALGIAPDAGRTVVADAVGGEVEIRLLRLPELVVGTRVFRHLRVAVCDLSAVEAKLGAAVDGVLGASFFRHADVAIDLAHDRLGIYPAGAFQRGDGPSLALLDEVPIRLVGGAIRVDATLGETPVDAAIDLGATGSLTNASTAAAVGVAPAGANRGTLGADGRTISMVEASFPSLAIGGARFEDAALSVAGDDDAATLLDGVGPRAHLGVDLFGGRLLLLSYRDRKLWLSR